MIEDRPSCPDVTPTVARRRRLLRLEVLALEAFAGVVSPLLLLAHWSLGRSLGAGVLAAVVLVALAKAILAWMPDRSNEGPVTLDCVTRGRFHMEALRPPPEQEGETHLVGLILVAIAMPFIVAVVAIRLALLYMCPLICVAGIALAERDTRVGPIIAALAAPIAVSVLNEFALTRPLAKRWNIPTDD